MGSKKELLTLTDMDNRAVSDLKKAVSNAFNMHNGTISDLEKELSNAFNRFYAASEKAKTLYMAMINQPLDFSFSKKWMMKQALCGDYTRIQIIMELRAAGLVRSVRKFDGTRYKSEIVLTSRIDQKEVAK